MMNKGVAIRYGDVAPEAKENFIPSVNDKADFVNLSQLQQYNLNFPNYANPCELYSVVLDGTAQAFPSVPEQANLGLWSEQISDDNGKFTKIVKKCFKDDTGKIICKKVKVNNPITLTLTSEGQYSSQGLTFTFDTYNQIYPTHINIKWFRYADGTMEELSPNGGVDFYPDNAFYFCRNFVEKYNKVVITFYSLNMPKNRLKLRVIDYGYGTFFYGDELRGVKIIQEIDPISTQISINTADFTLDSKSDMEYSFQAKQPLSVYFNGELKATTFVKKSTRKAKRLWDVTSEDYIGLMDSITFFGGVYDNKNATELLQEIFSVAKIPYCIDETFSNVTISGHIPYSTCREALMQVAFAIQAVVDTSNSDVVEVYALNDDVTQTVPLNRILQGQNFVDDDTVTSVEIVAHKYEKTDEYVELYGSQTEDVGIVGEEVFVKFSEPVWDLTLAGGTMIDSSANHAHFITTSTLLLLSGLKYTHTMETKTKKDHLVLASEIENIARIDNATLVSLNNIDKVAEKCYNWFMRNQSTNLSIVESKHVTGGKTITYGNAKYGIDKYGGKTPSIITYDERVNVGDVINAETEYLGIVSGRLIKQTFNLNSNVIIKEAVLK